MKLYTIKHKKDIINTNRFLYQGESITEKMRRVTTQNEAVESISPIIYTERKDGVLPEHDIRADKWDIAQKAMEHVSEEKRIKRRKYLESKGYQFDDNGNFIGVDKPTSAE